MGLQTERLGATDKEPLALEVSSQLLSASALLLHLEFSLRGVKVIAKKSWAMTDDFEAYFTYNNRLFVMEAPFTNIWVSLVGPQADEALFGEVEHAIRNYGWRNGLLWPFAFMKYFVLPSNPSRAFVEQHKSGVGA